jgi:membrane protein DedA with SNARE-associated domain
MFPILAGLALGTLITEDLACIAAGVLIAQGRIPFLEGTLACLAGIFAGDMMLFMAGRLVGPRALQWPPLAKFLPKEGVDRATAWLQKRGLIVVLLSRFTPGLRLPTYFAAGLLPTRAAAFAGHFFLAAAIWTPMLIGATMLLGEPALRQIFAQTSHSLVAFLSIFALATLAWRVLKPLFDHAGRRRMLGRWRRTLRWEFWPPWLTYLPLLPYLAFLMIRHRSVTLFTSTNPGIASAGFAGESKSEILSRLRGTGAAAEFSLIAADLPFEKRLEAARQFMSNREIDFPVVMKPDVGERGSGVAVVRSETDLETYLRAASGDTILQRYVAGAEFGVFYYRHPDEERGRIFSITEKRFPHVTGDGSTTLRDLILNDARAVCLADVYEKSAKRPVNSVPAPGERVQLVELGSHCRGAVFLDGMFLKTAAMEQAIDRISRSYPGVFFGRYDIRTPSVELFQQGECFYVIEFNGVSAEATHIYDPSVSIIAAYRVLYQQWKIAFEIGAANRARGFRPMKLTELITLIATWASRTPHLAS